jgi:DNA-binding Lrp family transcriptional regulator
VPAPREGARRRRRHRATRSPSSRPPRSARGLTAIVEVVLDRQSAEALAAFEARAVADGAVRQCHRVSPGPDFVLVVEVADMAAYQVLVERLFTQDANVRNVKAFFSVRRAKFETRIELPSPGRT